MAEDQYIKLLKELKKDLTSDSLQIRKRRRKINEDPTIVNNIPNQVTDELISDYKISENDSDSYDSDDFEDVNLVNTPKIALDIKNTDYDTIKPSSDTFTININKYENEPKKKLKKFNIINSEERKYRKLYHQLYLAAMIIHGSIRNQWCNDYKTMLALKQIIPVKALSLLFQKDDNKIINSVKSRRFLDGIRMIMDLYRKKFRVTSKGLIRKNWNELSIPQTKVERNVSFDKFTYLLSCFKGSRDIGAQGFVCLLRSIGLKARLVFSLQPPDFTSTSSYPKIEISKLEVNNNKSIQKFKGVDSKVAFLSNVRQNTLNSNNNTPAYTFDDTPYPVFWVEVWNKYSKKWISVDPIVLELLEYAPLRKKSKFEPPSSYERNQLTYVIAYDNMGGVKDVTRRYSQYYNAKTIKKKIIFRSEIDEEWYNRVIRAVNNPLRALKITNMDILELKEFRDRDLAEGMPNNLIDFKNHPIYALECQLKQNEIIYPKNETSKYGTFRNKSFGRSKNSQPEVFQVYKRSHVHYLRSVKAWLLRGRVLKLGEQPLKIKRKGFLLRKSNSAIDNNDDDDDIDDDDDVTRLYAEFQTKLYIPQPIINGKVPKNAYGNIDVYTPTMIPENGYLLNTTGKYSMKLAQRAVDILQIDYAKAIVAFDFGNRSGGKKEHNRIPTVREGGIVIDKQYKEAVIAVLDCLLEEEEDLLRERVELNSLKNWMLILKKLRISDRLNKEHGAIDSSVQSQDFDKELNASSDSSFVNRADSKLLDVEHVQNQEITFGGFILESGTYKSPSYVDQHFASNNDNDNNQNYIFSENESDHYQNNDNLGNCFFHTKDVEQQNNSGISRMEPRAAIEEYDPENTFEDEFMINDQISDEKDNTSDDFVEGGFIIDDNEKSDEEKSSLVKINTKNINTPTNEEDMPDEFFKVDKNGELVYDPDNSSNSINYTSWDGNVVNQNLGVKDSIDQDISSNALQSQVCINNNSSLPKSSNTTFEDNESLDSIRKNILSVSGESENESENDSFDIDPIDTNFAAEEDFDFEYSDSE